MDGELRGVYGESTFGDFDRSERGLIQLPTVEKHGVIWVCLTPGLTIDIDSWLGDWGPQLASLKLDECHVFSSRLMPGPNWKATIEGYLEAYHFAATHPNTVFAVNHGNTMVFDGFGPHERLGFALRTIDDVMDAPESEWEEVMRLNFVRLRQLTHALAPQMMKSGFGRIIHISGGDGFAAHVNERAHNIVSKAGIHGLTKALAKEFGPRGITVNTVAPGPFRSKMMGYLLDDPDSRNRIARRVPRRRIGEPEDVAGAVIYLASRAGAFLTGALIPVDGGLTAV